MRNAVLVLTNSGDGTHSDVIINKLNRLGVDVFRFDVDRLTRGELKIRFATDKTAFGFEMQKGNARLHSTDIRSIWYRRPNFLDAPIQDPVQRRYAETETAHFLEGLWAATPDVFWLSNPVNLERARKKILQLKLARELGFDIPRTIVTNEPERFKKFFRTCGGRIVFKSIHAATCAVESVEIPAGCAPSWSTGPTRKQDPDD